MEPITNPNEQKEILAGIFPAGTTTVKLDDFTIKLVTPPRGLIQLEVHNSDTLGGRPLIYFRVHYKGRGPTAALLANEGGKIYLLHDGRAHKKGFGRPIAEHLREIGGRDYFLIGECNRDIFKSIISFHCSRVGSLDDSTGFAPAFDPGPVDPAFVMSFIRNATAKHNSICTDLKDLAEARGWKIVARRTCSPDLAVERVGQRILFEVKPSGDLHSIASAVGQLLLYNTEIKAQLLSIVAPKNESVWMRVESLLRELSIKWYEWPDDDKSPHEITSVLD